MRRIVGECTDVDERDAVGIRFEPAAAIDENQDGTRGSNLIAPAKSQSLATAHPARSKSRDFVRLSGLYMTPGLSVAERVWQATAAELLAADSGPLDDLVLAYPTTTRKSQGSEGLHSARFACCLSSPRRSLYQTHSGRSAVAAGTRPHVESPGGLSPPGAPRSVREPLDSYGSRCSAVSMTELPVGEECWIYAA